MEAPPPERVSFTLNEPVLSVAFPPTTRRGFTVISPMDMGLPALSTGVISTEKLSPSFSIVAAVVETDARSPPKTPVRFGVGVGTGSAFVTVTFTLAILLYLLLLAVALVALA